MRFALLDVLTVGGPPRAAEREVLPARAAPPPDGRAESEALAAIAGEFRHLREQEQSLLRRQAESLETVAEALSRLVEGREAPAPAPTPVPAQELQELEAVRAELAEARARADRATRRLESTQVKLRRAREELAAEKAPWWRRRRARSALG
jgi:hypothetical protein